MDLNSFQTYLNAQLPRLAELHTLLSLPPSELSADHARLDAAIRSAVSGVIESRQKEVEEWRAKIAAARARVIRYCDGLSVVGEDRELASAADASDPMPKQLSHLVDSEAFLQEQYEERLARILKLRKQVSALATLLGAGFPLAIPPSVANLPQQAVDGDVPLVPLNLDHLAELDKLIVAGQAEKARRVAEIKERFLVLLWLHYEMCLPALTIPSTLSLALLPVPAGEQAATFQRYQNGLGDFIAKNQPGEEDTADAKITGDLAVDPEDGLVEWTVKLEKLWDTEKMSREQRIQSTYDALAPIWERLEVPEAERETFVDEHRGLAMEMIEAYEAELQRVTDIRNANLLEYVERVRRDIEQLWETLHYGDSQKGSFAGFWSESLSEELLTEHEEYLAKLQAEWDLKQPVLAKVQEWYAILQDEQDLAVRMTDPNRFKKGGAAMLQEEKMRKRVNVLKPKIEKELFTVLQDWEIEFEEPLLVEGENILEELQAIIEAREADLATKKRGKTGVTPSRSQTPGRTVTPGTAQAARKREATTPTPSVSQAAKRARTTAASQATSLSASTSSMTSTASRVPTCSLPRPGQAASRTTSATSRTTSDHRVLGSSSAQNRIASRPQAPIEDKRVAASKLGLAAGRRPMRRDSFRPRPSVAPLERPVLGGRFGVAQSQGDVF